jgi:hypothetical protein
MNRLLAIGFEPSGHWTLSDNVLYFELTRNSAARNILYAFVVDGTVTYVGKTIRSLRERMGGYKHPAPSQSTNLRNNAQIRAQLRAGAAVDILALPDNGLLHFGQFHINLAAGLEDDIIRSVDPEWNGGRLEPDTAPPAPLAPLSTVALPSPAAGIRFVLHKTYFARGFFNLSVSESGLFASDGDEIEIFCGDALQPILGIINRTANTNGTPRIIGGTDLRDWFHRDAHEMQEVSIELLSPTSICLRLAP